MCKKSLLFSLLLGATFVSAFNLFAQTGSIIGEIQDEKGAPVPGANILIKGTRIGAASGVSGGYRIDNVPAGNYVLVVKFIGYKTVEKEVQVVSNEATQALFVLTEGDPLIMQEIIITEEGYGVHRTISGSKTNARLLDLPQSIQVVNKDLLHDQGLNYLGDVLKNVSGVNTFSEYQDYNIRGFRSQGDEGTIKQNGLNQAHGFFNRVRLDNVERVEVVKGPAGALYGTSEPGGFINIITKQPRAQRQTTIRGVAGSYDKSQAHFASTGPLPLAEKLGSLLYRVDIGHSNDGSYRANEQFIHSYVIGALSWLPSDNTILRLGGEWFDELNRGQRNRGLPFFNHKFVDVPLSYTQNEPHDFIAIEAYTWRARLDHKFSNNLNFDVALSYLTNQRSQEYHEPRGLLSDGRTMRREFRQQYRERQQLSTAGNFTYKLPNLNNEILAGVEYTKREGIYRRATALDSVQGGPVKPIDIFDQVFAPDDRPAKFDYYGDDVPGGISSLLTTIDNTDDELGFYLQDRFDIGRFKFLAGFRWDSFGQAADNGDSYDRNAFSLRGGVVYQPQANFSTYLSYGEGYRPVAASRLLDPERYGGPFDPEESWNLEGGVKGSFLNGRFTTTVALYNLVKRNILRPSETEELPDREVQIGEVTSRGLEMDLGGYITDQWSLTASYTHSFKAEVTQDISEEFLGVPNENNPKNSFNLWSRYNWPILDGQGSLGVAAGANFMSSRFTFTEGDILPSYEVFDAAIFLNYSNIGISLNIFNITAQEYFTGGYGGRNGGWRGTPRSADVSISYTFN